MTVREIGDILNQWAPLHYAEDFDNVGLLIGDPEAQVNGILVTLDTLENVLDEALAKQCNLIVSFHPIIFQGIKRLTGQSYVERVAIKAISNNIAIFCIHTALDNSATGVNAKICQVLGLHNTSILIPKAKTIKKLVTYVPEKSSEELREKLFATGAGTLGNYSNCSFSTSGIGSLSRLRKRLQNAKADVAVHTIRGVGYLLSSEDEAP